jgi:hypothetical protein
VVIISARILSYAVAYVRVDRISGRKQFGSSSKSSEPGRHKSGIQREAAMALFGKEDPNRKVLKLPFLNV